MAKSFMSFLLGEKKSSSSVAKERLQIILAHERSAASGPSPDYLPKLQAEIMAVIAKYIQIPPEDIKIQVDREADLEVLEVKVELPERPTAR